MHDNWLVLQILLISTQFADPYFLLRKKHSMIRDHRGDYTCKNACKRCLTFSFFGLFGMSSRVLYPGEGWYSLSTYLITSTLNKTVGWLKRVTWFSSFILIMWPSLSGNAVSGSSDFFDTPNLLILFFLWSFCFFLCWLSSVQCPVSYRSFHPLFARHHARVEL